MSQLALHGARKKNPVYDVDYSRRMEQEDFIAWAKSERNKDRAWALERWSGWHDYVDAGQETSSGNKVEQLTKDKKDTTPLII